VRDNASVRPHDIGGMVGFGPVNPDEADGAFHTDWEARVFALNVALRRRGTYSPDEFRDAIEQMSRDAYHASSYYERWMHAITTLLIDKGVLAAEALADE
jgi:nitrile hydratase accessory protein